MNKLYLITGKKPLLSDNQPYNILVLSCYNIFIQLYVFV